MSDRRVRHACVAAIAFAAVALLPATAGAHCATTSTLTAGPSGERYTAWTGGNDCTSTTSTRAAATAAPAVKPPPVDAKAGTLTQVGHNPLMNRGMNAAIAVHGDYAYVGSRTDGGHGGPQGGLMVLDVSD